MAKLKKYESKRADGRFVYRRTIKKKTISIYARTLDELREKEIDFEKDRLNDIDVTADTNKILNFYFEKIMNLKISLSDTTRANYHYLYNKYVRSKLGNAKIKDIKHSDVCSFYNDLYHEDLAIGTIELINNIMSPVFELAVKDRILYSNPCNGALKELRTIKAKKDDERIALSDYEITQIVEFMENSKSYQKYVPLFTVLLGTGCRIGEALALTWNDIDFKNNEISINHAVSYKKVGSKSEFKIGTTKTKAGNRTISMTEEVKNALLSVKKDQLKNGFSNIEICGYSNFIFTNSKGMLFTSSNINRVIKKVVDKINKQLESQNKTAIRPFTAHSFRHTYATNLCRKETNLKLIQTVMGHERIETTMNIYAHAIKSEKKII